MSLYVSFADATELIGSECLHKLDNIRKYAFSWYSDDIHMAGQMISDSMSCIFQTPNFDFFVTY